MTGWQLFCALVDWNELALADLQGEARDCFSRYGVYPESIHQHDDCLLFIARNDEDRFLVIFGNNTSILDEFAGVDWAGLTAPAKVCDLNNANFRKLMVLFPFTCPVSHQGQNVSIGLGDRLGLAAPGHIRTVRQFGAFPVLAQQSMRELNLTGRTYDDVLSAAGWAVFQEGYHTGYGADGDHLKTAGEIKSALDLGFSMITLDCSDHIDNTAAQMEPQEVARRYAQLPAGERKQLEMKYLGLVFELAQGCQIRFDPADFQRMVLVYRQAIHHAVQIYKEVIAKAGRKIDFEVSIDETLTATSPESHFFTASELIGDGTAIASLAPRFSGEFQKGIDYRGDKARFAAELVLHARIADFFGYKLSIHSGSDKFSVFPDIGAETRGIFHLKTAGTNWLEAVRLIAAIRPELYRRMHDFALDNLDEAKKYYHISADPNRITPLDSLPDQDLPELMNQDDARQVLHITYGLILQAQNPDGSSRFKDEIHALLKSNEQAYVDTLKRHIGRHLQALGLATDQEFSEVSR